MDKAEKEQVEVVSQEIRLRLVQRAFHGANIHQWSWTGGLNQQVKVETVTVNEPAGL